MGLTTDREDPGLRDIGPDGMQAKYLVLSEEERARGFVRPVRRSYKHVGRAVCGMPAHEGDLDRVAPEGKVYVCAELPGHEGACDHTWLPLTPEEAEVALKEHRVGGCGTVTTMAQALAETYARDPDFYGGTFCAGPSCRTHPRVGAYGEFVWVAPDGTVLDERVGT